MNREAMCDLLKWKNDPHRKLLLLFGVRQTGKKKGMLYFFDEIQVSNRAITALKYFQERGFPHPVIAAGSLLGVAVNQKDYSPPVGKVNTMVLNPMTFDEFMEATGHGLHIAARTGASCGASQ